MCSLSLLMYSLTVRVELPAAFTFRFLIAWQSCFLPQPPWSLPLFRSKIEKFLTLAVLCYEACRVAQFLNSISEDDGLCCPLFVWNRKFPFTAEPPLGLERAAGSSSGQDWLSLTWLTLWKWFVLCFSSKQQGWSCCHFLPTQVPSAGDGWASSTYIVISEVLLPCSSLEQNLPPLLPYSDFFTHSHGVSFGNL